MGLLMKKPFPICVAILASCMVFFALIWIDSLGKCDVRWFYSLTVSWSCMLVSIWVSSTYVRSNSFQACKLTVSFFPNGGSIALPVGRS